ncbi:MAG: hypothetical protein DVB31_09800 [Verrucomicrobia bacterium]|nr:MAG: hypothetical protein DVB31_09800 [Verrucomicrobiota bacterium]
MKTTKNTTKPAGHFTFKPNPELRAMLDLMEKEHGREARDEWIRSAISEHAPAVIARMVAERNAKITTRARRGCKVASSVGGGR